LKYALAQKERECDELSAHQNKMTVVLRDKHEEMKVLKEGYENAVEELKELRFSKEAFEISQGELGDRVSRLSGEVNAYKAENSQLLTQVASLSEQLSGYTASGVTNVEHAELQSKFDALKMMNEKLMGEEKQSRDRILALEEALQKTIVCDNEANHHRAQVHAAEISNLEYEIANLKRIFDAYRARQSSTPITHTIDTDPRVLLETVTRLITERDFAISEANRLENNARVAMEDAHYSQRQTAIQTDAVRNQSNTIAQLSARIRDLESGVKMTKSAKASTVDTGAITRLRNENEALKAKLSEVDFGSLLENLRKLSERCQSVELKLHMPAKGLSSLSESYDSETAGTETRAKHSQLANEVRGRIRELAERLADIEAKNKIAPSSDPNISRSSSFGSLSPAPIQKQNSGLFGKLGKKKSDLNELQGQITQLRAENAKLREDASSSALSPTIEGASDEQVQLLRKEVAEFERRLERIAVVTAAVLSSSSGNSSAQDQVKIHGLERDVLNLRGKLTSAMKKYQEDVQSIDSKVQPLQSENEQMRQRLAEYDEKMGKLSAENEKLRGTNIFSAFLPST
jgi:chromosome segregation ATPase